MKKIAVIGYGYVGKAVAEFFKQQYHVAVFDPAYPPELEPSHEEAGIYFYREESLLRDLEAVLICVPTEMKEDGSADTSIVEHVIRTIEAPLFIIKSTIPPGTTKRLAKETGKNLVFSPEYIGEGKYHMPVWKGYPHPTDMRQHNFFIFGGDREDTQKAIQVFLPIAGPDAFFAQTDPTTAELTKYMENSWGATKVTFANEFYEIAEVFGVQYEELRELFLLDKRTERIHTAVFRDKRGFGGKCFPKDVNAIVKVTEKAGYIPELLKEVLSSNKKFRGEL